MSIKPGQQSGVWHQCGALDSQCVTNLVLTVRGDDITRTRANTWSLAYFKSVILHNNVIRAEPGLLEVSKGSCKIPVHQKPALFSPSCGSPGKIRCPSRDKFGQLRVQTSQTHIGDLLLGKIPKKAELSRSRSTSLLHHGLVTSNNVIRAEPGLITAAEHDSLLEQTSKTLVLSVEPSSCGNVAAASQFSFFP